MSSIRKWFYDHIGVLFWLIAIGALVSALSETYRIASGLLVVLILVYIIVFRKSIKEYKAKSFNSRWDRIQWLIKHF